jgi:hypothetical protein
MPQDAMAEAAVLDWLLDIVPSALLQAKCNAGRVLAVSVTDRRVHLQNTYFTIDASAHGFKFSSVVPFA